MERRLTAFVLPVLFLTLGLALFIPDRDEADPRPDQTAPARPAAPAAAPAPAAAGPGLAGPAPAAAGGQRNGDADRAAFDVRKSFGRPGERGGFHIWFDRRNASVYSIWLLDEPATPRVVGHTPWQIDDTYQLVRDVQRGIFSLTLAEADPSNRVLQVDLNAPWDVTETEDSITFSLRDEANGLTLHRTYRHELGHRELVLQLSVVADATRPAEPRAPARSEVALWLYGLSVVNPDSAHLLGNPAIAIGKTLDPATEAAEVTFHRADGRPNPSPLPRIATSSGAAAIDFAGTTNRFFGAFLRPHNEAAARACWLAEMEKWPATDALRGHALYSVPVANYRLKLSVPPDGERTDLDFRLYLGPKSAGIFDESPDYERYNEVMDIDLAPMCFCTIPGAKEMAQMLLWGLRNLYALVGSWGWAIVLLTLIVRGSLVPLNFRMQKSMRAYGAKASRLQPELEKIKERHAKDPKKLQQAMIAFQREHKLFPPIGGCLPLLITIPVFLGLFTALRVAYELRCQPFLGWIQDLSQPDQLFEIGMSWLPHFNLLPLLMVGLWLVLQSGTPLPNDPQQRQVMKIMRFMPLLFGVMLYNYASGLMVYMVTSSLLGIVEQRVTKKILGPPPQVGVAAMPTF